VKVPNGQIHLTTRSRGRTRKRRGQWIPWQRRGGGRERGRKDLETKTEEKPTRQSEHPAFSASLPSFLPPLPPQREVNFPQKDGRGQRQMRVRKEEAVEEEGVEGGGGEG